MIGDIYLALKNWPKQQTINDLTSKLEAAKQTNNELSQAIKDAQSIRDYSDNAVKSVGAK